MVNRGSRSSDLVMSLKKKLVRVAKIFLRIQKVLLGLTILLVTQIKNAIVGKHVKTVKLAGKVVLISGYNDSILGQALRDELLRAGCKVCVTKSPKFPKSAESGYCESDNYKEYKTNTACYDDMNELKSSIKKTVGYVDILIILSPDIPDVDIFQACKSNFPQFIGDTVKSMFWATKCFLDGMIEKEAGQIVLVAPHCDKSDVANLLRRSMMCFVESIHTELLMFRRPFISVTLVKNHRFRENLSTNYDEAASRIINGIVKKQSVVEVLGEYDGNNGMRRFLAFLVEITISLKNIMLNVLGLRITSSISNRIALVTGGGMGIGKEIALNLARHGCNVAIADIDYEVAQNTATYIRRLNVQAMAYKTDVSNVNDIAQLRANIEKDMGNVDILVNNAGLMPVATILQSKVQTIEKTIDVNLVAHLLTVKEFLPSMLQSKRGHIVAISSIAAFHPLPAGILYCTTKYGVTGFMDSLQYSLEKTDRSFVKTTTIHPYFTKTRTDLFELLGHDPIFKLLPWLEAKYVGIKIIEGILKEERRVFIPTIKYISLLRTITPTAVKNYLTKISITSFRGMENEGKVLT